MIHAEPQIQPKLEIGQPGDQYEQEADAVADRVMRMPATTNAGDEEDGMLQPKLQPGPYSKLQLVPLPSNPMVQLKCAECEEEDKVQMVPLPSNPLFQNQPPQVQKYEGDDEEEMVQMKPAIQREGDGTAHASPQITQQLNQTKGNGSHLPDGVQQELSGKMGADFSNVKIHTDSTAAQLSQDLGAKAFTHGQDVYFNKGNYNPSSSEGKHLLAHELTHTVQQGGGEIKSMIQRSAKATWEDSTVADQKALFDYEASKKQKKKYGKHEMLRQTVSGLTELAKTQALSEDQNKELQKSQKKLDKLRKKDKEVTLPVIDKILKINANYHYVKSVDSVEGTKLEVNDEIIEEVKKKLRMVGKPGLFEHVMWSSSGNMYDLGVKFDINFIPHKQRTGDYQFRTSGEPWYDENTEKLMDQNPWDNPFAFVTKDAITDMSWEELKTFVSTNGLKKFTWGNDDGRDFVEYERAANDKIEFSKSDQWELKTAIREEWKAQESQLADPQALETTTLGTGSKSSVSVDPEKSAPKKKEFYRYTKQPGRNDSYYDDVQDKFKEKVKLDYTKPGQELPRWKAIAGIIIHEIGHNIGMTHSDFGIMSPSTEVDGFEYKKVNIGGTSAGSATTTTGEDPKARYAYERIWKLSDEKVLRGNVQKLVNRIQVMTPELGARNQSTGELSDIQNLWSSKTQDLKTVFKNKDYKALFADQFLVSLLAIPHSVSKSYSKNDRVILQSVIDKGYMITLDDWKALSQGVRDSIEKRTLDEYQGTSGTGQGHTFFESPAEMSKL